MFQHMLRCDSTQVFPLFCTVQQAFITIFYMYVDLSHMNKTDGKWLNSFPYRCCLKAAHFKDQETNPVENHLEKSELHVLFCTYDSIFICLVTFFILGKCLPIPKPVGKLQFIYNFFSAEHIISHTHLFLWWHVYARRYTIKSQKIFFYFS